MSAGILLAAVFLLSWLLTCLYLLLARERLVDEPGPRSSHARPTPTGGGIGLVVALSVGVILLPEAGSDWRLAVALAAGLALIGYMDDLRGLPVLPRLLAQAAAVTTFIWVAGMPLDVRPGPGAVLGGGLLVLALVWLVNAFNFMDGIDALAAGQALFMASSGALLASGAGGATPVVLLCIAAAAGGFLVLNWPPARLFMGDTGSLALGFLLAVAVPLTFARGEVSPAAWLILWAPFLCDTGLTLLQRAWRREPLYQAHRGHAYQRLARAWGGHRRVTLAVFALDFAWLLPLAMAAERAPGFAAPIVAIALLPVLAGVAWILRRYP